MIFVFSAKVPLDHLSYDNGVWLKMGVKTSGDKTNTVCSEDHSLQE